MCFPVRAIPIVPVTHDLPDLATAHPPTGGVCLLYASIRNYLNVYQLEDGKNKMWFVHTVGYFIAAKMNELN